MSSNGYEIAGRPVTDSALYPWALGSAARSMLFYAQQDGGGDRLALCAIANYYCLFHLGMFLIFSCPVLQTGQTKKRIQAGISDGSDPSPKIRHCDLLASLRSGTRHGLPESVIAATEKARHLREYINYGPRITWRGTGGIWVNTCVHDVRQLDEQRAELRSVFVDAVDWACDWGADDGIWVVHSLSDVGNFFTGEDMFYGAWCTPDEAAVAESLRIPLAEMARQKVYVDREAG